jgi:hypothetical protein
MLWLVVAKTRAHLLPYRVHRCDFFRHRHARAPSEDSDGLAPHRGLTRPLDGHTPGGVPCRPGHARGRRCHAERGAKRSPGEALPVERCATHSCGCPARARGDASFQSSPTQQRDGAGVAQAELGWDTGRLLRSFVHYAKGRPASPAALPTLRLQLNDALTWCCGDCPVVVVVDVCGCVLPRAVAVVLSLVSPHFIPSAIPPISNFFVGAAAVPPAAPCPLTLTPSLGRWGPPGTCTSGCHPNR